MANINFFRYLEAAFRYKLKNPDAPSYKDPYYDLPYETTGNKRGIFDYSRNGNTALPAIYRQFPDTKEGNLQMIKQVISDLDKHANQELTNYFHPAVAPEENAPDVTKTTRESIQPPPPSAVGPGAIPSVTTPRVSMPRIPIPKVAAATPKQPEETTKEKTPQSKLSGMLTRIQNIQTPSFLKTFGSNAKIFAKNNSGRIFDGLKGIAGGVGRGLGGVASTGLSGATPHLGRAFHGGLNAIERISQPGGLGGGSVGRVIQSRGKQVFVAVLLALFLLTGLGVLTGTTPPAPAAPLPSSPPGGGGDIASCTFYRYDQSPAGLKFRIPEWPALINEIATKVGVPAAVIASILRVESGGSFYTTDSSYITNDYDAHTNGLVYGVMQFFPATFEGIFNRHQSELKELFGKTSVTTEIVPQDRMAPADVFRIYSIRDQIIAAAYKIKDDAGVPPPYDREAIIRIIIAYFDPAGGKCTYTSGDGKTYNYCDAVWDSYAGCSVAPGYLASCPLAGERNIVCGSYGSDPIYNEVCGGESPNSEDRGHCGRIYGSCEYGPAARRAHAIDVTAAPGETVYLPTIEGKTVVWNHTIGSSVPPADGGGYWHNFWAALGEDKWELYLIHVNEGLIGFSGGKDHYESGDPVATIADTSFDHVHVNIGKNPRFDDYGDGWLKPEDIGMCTK